MPVDNAIGRITASGAVRYFYAGRCISDPRDIAAGPDGALWFINDDSNTIGRITTTGQVSHYAGPSGMSTAGSMIAAGPDGAVWFTNPATSTIGRITTSATPQIRKQAPATGAHGNRAAITGRNISPAAKAGL